MRPAPSIANVNCAGNNRLMPGTARLVLVSSRRSDEGPGRLAAHSRPGEVRRLRRRLTVAECVATSCGALAAVVAQVAYALLTGATPF